MSENDQPAGDAGGDDDRKPETTEFPAGRTAVDLAASTLGHDMLDALVAELEKMPEAFAKLPQHAQEATIRRLDHAVRQIVTKALAILFHGEYPACRAVLESIAIKDGIKASLKIARTEHHLVELAEHVGTPVVVVLAQPDMWFDRMGEIKGRKDQPDLFDRGEEADRPDDAESGEQASGATEEGDDLPPISERLDPETPPEAPADLTLEADPLWKQAVAALERINILVPQETAEKWREEDCTEAAYWVQVVESAPKDLPPCPACVKPHIPVGWKRPRKKKH
jgi:hypothetical protein